MDLAKHLQACVMEAAEMNLWRQEGIHRGKMPKWRPASSGLNIEHKYPLTVSERLGDERVRLPNCGIFYSDADQMKEAENI